MTKFLILFASIITTWIIHVLLVTTYIKHFSDTHGLNFRIIYSLDLAATFSIMLVIYLSKVSQPVRLLWILVATIGFLAIVDTLISLSQKSVRSNFDIFHFFMAYSLAAIAMTIKYKIKSN